MYAKKGEKTFNSDKAFGYLGAIDQYVFETCPGTAVAATAVDYKFQGIPASLPAGTTKIKFTNGAPKEDHEIAIARLLPGNEGMDPVKLFQMSDKKAAKYADLERAVFTYAPAGDVGYTVTRARAGHVRVRMLHPRGWEGQRRAALHAGHVRDVHRLVVPRGRSGSRWVP